MNLGYYNKTHQLGGRMSSTSGDLKSSLTLPRRLRDVQDLILQRLELLTPFFSVIAFTNFQQAQLAGVSILCFCAAWTTAPQIASISVGAPRKTSCNMDEWFAAVFRATSSAAAMGSENGNWIFSAFSHLCSFACQCTHHFAGRGAFQ